MRGKDMRHRNFLTWIVVGGLATFALAVGAVASLAGGMSAKDQFVAQMNQERAAAIAAPRAPKNAAGPAAPSARLFRQSGILDIHQGPVNSSEFLVSNVWQGPVNGSADTWLVVWAGARVNSDGSSGAPGLIVHRQTPTADGTSVSDETIGTFTAKGASGPLTITAQSGAMLDLRTASGQLVRFDLQTLRFDG
jgi:hypothetical protein